MFSRIVTEDFCQQDLYTQLSHSCNTAGAIVTFTGLVRDYNNAGPIDGIELEHYPGMTEQALSRLLELANKRFDLVNAGIVHRVGRLDNHAQIVWVGTASRHRQQAFDAASFIMDQLKQSVPLWKKEWVGTQANWVSAKESDSLAAKKWLADVQDS